MDYEALMKAAEQARKLAYAPYSGFRVGAALLATDGSVYCGCNVENASFSATNCAERTAFFRAVSDGMRKFSAIAIVGGKGEALSELCAPCGVCRQVMAEFCNSDFQIVLGHSGNLKIYTLGELLPCTFTDMDGERESTP